MSLKTISISRRDHVYRVHCLFVWSMLEAEELCSLEIVMVLLGELQVGLVSTPSSANKPFKKI